MSRVRVRLVYEAEYEVNLPSDGYAGCSDLEAAVEVDREGWLHDDSHLFLDAVGAVPIEFSWEER